MRDVLSRFVRVLLAMVAVMGAPLMQPATAAAAPAKNQPDKVVVGAFIHDIQQIDLEADSFTIDFYLWFRWTSDKADPADSIEPMNSNGVDNTTSSSTGGVTGKPLFDEPLIMPDGSKYMAFRYQGVFSRKMNLEKYPFDVQTLAVIFEDQNQDVRELEFVPDTTPVAISPAVTMPGYEIGTPSLVVTEHPYATNFGDLTAPPNVEYSRIIITVPVTRDPLPYLVKIILPILIVILITSLIYLIPARMEDARTGIGVTAMLTIVALQWTTDSNLPAVEYLTMLDLIYIVSLMYVLIAMGYTVLASRRKAFEAEEALTKSIDRRVGVASLVVYGVLMVLTVLIYLSDQSVEPLL